MRSGKEAVPVSRCTRPGVSLGCVPGWELLGHGLGYFIF